jgi:hypothetical protein
MCCTCRADLLCTALLYQQVLVRSHVFQQSCSTPFTQGGGQKSQGKASSNAIRTPPGKLPEVQLLNSAATRHSNARSQVHTA